MREIKFRVELDGEFFIMTMENFYEDGYQFKDGGGELRGQFTGLKDKKGKEIYEGDIVMLNSHICVVCYSEDRFGFKEIKYLDEDEIIDQHLGLAVYRGYVEVIGNIYENPELLK